MIKHSLGAVFCAALLLISYPSASAQSVDQLISEVGRSFSFEYEKPYYPMNSKRDVEQIQREAVLESLFVRLNLDSVVDRLEEGSVLYKIMHDPEFNSYMNSQYNLKLLLKSILLEAAVARRQQSQGKIYKSFVYELVILETIIYKNLSLPKEDHKYFTYSLLLATGFAAIEGENGSVENKSETPKVSDIIKTFDGLKKKLTKNNKRLLYDLDPDTSMYMHRWEWRNKLTKFQDIPLGFTAVMLATVAVTWVGAELLTFFSGQSPVLDWFRVPEGLPFSQFKTENPTLLSALYTVSQMIGQLFVATAAVAVGTDPNHGLPRLFTELTPFLKVKSKDTKRLAKAVSDFRSNPNICIGILGK